MTFIFINIFDSYGGDKEAMEEDVGGKNICIYEELKGNYFGN